MNNLLAKIRAIDHEPREGMDFCEGCGFEFYLEDMLWGPEDCRYCRGCAAECAGCGVVYLKGELVDGICKDCRDADEDGDADA